MIWYFKGASLKAQLKNAIGFSFPWSSFCKRTTAMVCSDANEKMKKSLSNCGLVRTGAWVKAALILSKACLVSRDHFTLGFSFP